MRLTHRFDHIQIEGEHGFGKPEERAYLHAMEALGVTAPETWMIGDNLEWEVEAPQRLGIFAIWIDVHGAGLPAGSPSSRSHHPLADGTPAREPLTAVGVPLSPAAARRHSQQTALYKSYTNGPKL